MKKSAFSRFLVRWFVSGLGLWIAAALLGSDKVSFENQFATIVGAGLILAIVNTIIKPLVVFLSLPALLLSLGIFMLVINGFTVWLAAQIYEPFAIAGFGTAIIVGMVIAVTNFLVSALLSDEK